MEVFLVLLLIVGFVISMVSSSSQKGRIETLENQVKLLNHELQKLAQSLKDNFVKPEEKKPEDVTAYLPKPESLLAESKPIPTPEPIVEETVSPLLPPPIEEVIPLENATPPIVPAEPESIGDAAPEATDTPAPEAITPPALENETPANPEWYWQPHEAPLVSGEKEIQKQKPPKQKSRTSAEWEALIGGKILNRIGALAIIIGMGFFLKYAIDNNWISETTRVIIGAGVGAVMLFGGHYFQKKDFKIFSQGLVGAGLAILYLSVYASFNYYHVITNQGIAIALMSVVTAITFWQGFKYDSLIIGLFGWLGGFMTPFLFSTGKANETGLFTYIAFLDVALLLIVLRKEKWFVLESLTLLGTIVVYYLWYLNYYDADKMGVSIFFLSLFWLMFLAFEALRVVNTNKKITYLHQLISIANGGFFFGSICLILNPQHDRWLGLVSVITAAIYFGVFILIKRKRPDEQNLYVRYLLSVVLLMVLSAEIEFDNFGITIAWAGEALALSLIAARYKNNIVLYCALVVTVLACVNFSISPDAFFIQVQNFHLLYSWRTLALLSILVSAAGSYLLTVNYQHKYIYYISNGLVFTWVLSLFLIVTLETNDLFGQLMQTTDKVWAAFYQHNLFFFFGIEWMLIAMPLVWFGLRRKPDALLISSIILTIISVITSFGFGIASYQPVEMFKPFFNMRTLAFGFPAICIFTQVQWINKKKLYEWLPNYLHLLRILVVALVFTLITVETRDLFQSLSLHANKVWAAFYDNNLTFTLSVEWILLSMVFIWFGLRRKIYSYFYCGLLITTAAVLTGTIAGIIPYQPMELYHLVLNMRGLTLILLALCLFVLSKWVNKHQLFDWFETVVAILRVAMVTVIFTLITVELRDLFQSLSLKADKVWASFYDNNLTFALAIGWILLAMPVLWFGIRKNIYVYLFCGLLITTAAVFLGAISGAMPYRPMELYRLLVNMRAITLCLLAVALFIQSRWVAKESLYNWFKDALNIIRAAMIAVIFILISVELRDLFLSRSLHADKTWISFYDNNLTFALAIGWILLAMPVLWFGFRKKIYVFLFSGLLITAAAVLIACISGALPYQPMELYKPLLNMRGATMCLLALALFVQSRWIVKESLFNWFETALNVIRAVMIAVIFILITAETRDLFQNLGLHADKIWAAFYDSNVLFMLAAEWILLAMPVLWFGFRKKIHIFLYAGLLLTVLATITATAFGIMTYTPLQLFFPILNMRGLAILLVVFCMFLLSRWMEKQLLLDWFAMCLKVIRVVMTVIVFIFITVETKDAFEKQIAMITSSTTLQSANQMIANIHNEQQLFISGAWLLYSMLLLVLGIYKRRLSLRIAAIIIFGITIAKVFFYDLSNLNSLNRIISFIALGVILLLVSFLYQKFKGIIFAKEE